MTTKKIFTIPICNENITVEEARERIRKLLKSYDPDYWLMKDRQQKLDKLKRNVNTEGCK